MKLSTVFAIFLLSFCSNAEENFPDLIDNYVKNLVDESVLDFKFYGINHDYYKDGAVKHTNTVGYGHNPNKSSDFKLSSLSQKQIGELVKKAEDAGILLTVVENNPTKNLTTTYETKKQEDLQSPAAEILNNVGGFELGILEELLDTLYETKNVAKIYSYEFFANDKPKKRLTMTVHAQEVMVKAQKNMSTKMVEVAKKMLKKALKVDVDDKALFIVNQFDTKFSNYKWTVLINPVAYTFKSDVMVSFKYESTIYTILGVKTE